MPNTTPITPKIQNVSSVKLSVANFAKSGTVPIGALGTSPTFQTAFTPGGDGSRIDQIKVRSLGLNAASVLRLFYNDGTTNNLIHEQTLPSTGGSSTAITITAQTTGTNLFTSATALTVGQLIYVTAVSTLTALNVNTMYYVSSAPSATTFTLTDANTGAQINVASSVTGATGSAGSYPTLEQAALTDIDVTIPKNSTETASPIPYVKAGHKINATIGNIGAAPLNSGWQLTIHGADY